MNVPVYMIDYRGNLCKRNMPGASPDENPEPSSSSNQDWDCTLLLAEKKIILIVYFPSLEWKGPLRTEALGSGQCETIMVKFIGMQYLKVLGSLQLGNPAV